MHDFSTPQKCHWVKNKFCPIIAVRDEVFLQDIWCTVLSPCKHEFKKILKFLNQCVSWVHSSG
jgi:hypothetical protein